MSATTRPPRTTFRAGLSGRRPRRSRVGWFVVLTLSAGALSGIAAVLGVGPFGSVQEMAAEGLRHGAAPAQIAASTLFPTVGPRHKLVNIYDLSPQVPPGGHPRSGVGPVINFPAGSMAAIEARCEAAKQAVENRSEAVKQNVELQCEAAKQAYERSHP
jgi:hypothetical protein